jgi:peptidoglycan biosynthesis protein MviN/MurJ (putative lipid II flippase)
MAWISFFVLLSKIVGAIKEMVIAWRYGISPELDAYLFIFNVINWPIGIWFSVMTVVISPLMQKARVTASDELKLFRGELLGGTLLLGVVFALLLGISIAVLFQSKMTGLSVVSINAAKDMIIPLASLVPLGLLVGLLSAWMIADGQHANTLLEGVPALVIVVLIVAINGGGIETLVWATLAGFICHVLSLVVLLIRKKEISLPKFAIQSTLWSQFWKGFGIMLIGQALMTFSGIVDQLFAARISEGAIAELSYANRVLSLVLGLGGMVVTRATLPIFSKVATLDVRELNRLATRWACWLFIVGGGAALLSWGMAHWGVKILFERGAFSAENTDAVAWMIRWGGLQFPFYFSSMIFVSLLSSQRRYGLISFIGGINLITKILFNYWLIDSVGVAALMLSTVAMLSVSWVFLAFHVNR